MTCSLGKVNTSGCQTGNVNHTASGGHLEIKEKEMRKKEKKHAKKKILFRFRSNFPCKNGFPFLV